MTSSDDRAQTVAMAEMAIAAALDLLNLGINAYRGAQITDVDAKAIHDAVNVVAVRLAAAADARAKDRPET